MIDNRGIGVLGRVLAGGLLLSLAACGECESCKTPASPEKPTSPSAPVAATPEPDAVYIVRGRVVMVPDPKNPTTEFRVRHEEIPTFKNSEGKVVGMREMEMPFPVGDAKLLEGVAVGDLVELTFSDWYKPVRSYKVTKLTKLPADTKLNISDD